MGNCLIIKKHGFTKTKFRDTRISLVNKWDSNFTYTATTAGTYIVTGLGTSTTASVSDGGELLYFNIGYQFCAVADLPVGGKLTLTDPSACIMGMIPVTNTIIIQQSNKYVNNATARTTLTDQKTDTLFIGAASYQWHSCTSGSARGVRAGGTNIKITGTSSDDVTVTDSTALNGGWNDSFGNWGNEMIVSIVPTSDTNTMWTEGYLTAPEWGNSCSSWLFQIAKKI